MRKLLAALLLLAAPAYADMYQDAGNAKLPEAQDNLGIGRSVTAYGAKCDGTTNDTTAIQAAIAANASGYLTLPTGTCVASGLVISKDIRISGSGRKQSYLRAPLGATTPVITVQIDNPGGPYAGVAQLDNFTITSTSAIDPPGVNNVHGIRFVKSGTVQAELTLNDMTVSQVPGSCIYGEPGAGIFVQASNFTCVLPNQYGIYANSVTDWVFNGGQLYGAKLHNVLCSGCSHFHFQNVNNFSAQQDNIHLYSANNFQWMGGDIGGPVGSSVFVDNRTGGTTYIGGGGTLSGTATVGATAATLHIDAANTGNVYLDNTWFMQNITPEPAYINIVSGNTGYVYGTGVAFKKGSVYTDWLATGVITGDRRFYRGTEPMRTWTPTLVGSTAGTAAMSVQVGNYTVSDGAVRLWGKAQASSLAGLTGFLRVGGLPVVPIGGVGQTGTCTITPDVGWTAPANYTVLTGVLNGGSSPTSILLYRSSTAGGVSAETSVSEWAAGSSIIFSCDYRY